MLQQHRHSSYCKRNRQCRFNFSHLPSSETIIAEQCPDPEQCEQAHKTLVKVRKVLPDYSDVDTLDNVLIKANVEKILRKSIRSY